MNLIEELRNKTSRDNRDLLDRAADRIEELEAKQSEGEWKKRGNEKTCSLCKFIYYSNNDNWNYCPNCGAKMKGE